MSHRTRLVRVFFCLVTTVYLIGNIWKNFTGGCRMSLSLPEAFSSTLSTAMQRIKNPVFGSFVISWFFFNWRNVLYLLFSDERISWRIDYISGNSNWGTAIIYPLVSTALLCAVLPWTNNLIAKWQSKPLDNTDYIDHVQKAKSIRRSTQIERMKARESVAYERSVTGARKEIQEMKENILASKEKMGELTKELEDKNQEIITLKGASSTLESLLIEKERANDQLNFELKEALLEIRKMKDGVPLVFPPSYKREEPVEKDKFTGATPAGNILAEVLKPFKNKTKPTDHNQ